MKPKQNELGQIVIDMNSHSLKSRAPRPPSSFYDMLKAEPGIIDDEVHIDNVEDEEQGRVGE